MEFLSLHELSVQLDTSVRVLRHRLRQLLADGKLIEPQECRRDDYVDPTHFVWRVDPAAFVRATGLRPVTTRASQPLPPATRSVDQPTRVATQPPNPPAQTLPNVDTKTPGMEREMIDLLKDQVRVKDGQIGELTTQTKTLTALNEKLTGVVVHQSEEIRSLLRLTGGKTELSEFVTTPDIQTGNPATHPDNKAAAEGSDFGSHPTDAGNGQGSVRAA